MKSQIQIDDLKFQLKEYVNKNNDLINENAKLKIECNDLIIGQEEKEKKLLQVEKSYSIQFDELNQALIILKDSNTSLQIEKQNIQKDLVALQTFHDNLQNENNSLKQENFKLQLNIQEKDKQILELYDEVTMAKNDKSTLEEKVTREIEEKKLFRLEIIELQKEINSLELKLRSKTEEMNFLSQNIMRLEKENKENLILKEEFQMINNVKNLREKKFEQFDNFDYLRNTYTNKVNSSPSSKGTKRKFKEIKNEIKLKNPQRKREKLSEYDQNRIANMTNYEKLKLRTLELDLENKNIHKILEDISKQEAAISNKNCNKNIDLTSYITK